MQNKKIGKSEILDLANSVEEQEEIDKSDLKIAGVYVGGEIGFPLRIFSEEDSNNPGEPKNFSSAYDKACSALDTDKVYSYEEHGFVWFTTEE